MNGSPFGGGPRTQDQSRDQGDLHLATEDLKPKFASPGRPGVVTMTSSDNQPFDDLLDLGIATAFGMSAGRTATGSPAAPALELAGPRAETLADLPSKVGKYQIVELVAQGGMGVVARARDGELERDVAIKFLRHSLSANPALQQLFRHEARVMGALEHPGIVAIHDLGTTDDGRLFYVMKLVEGESLQALLQRAARPNEPSARADRRHAITAFVRVCETMAFAHSRGIVHGDLKPANVMLGAFGEVQILDWGFARAVQSLRAERDDADDRASPRVAGTPAFMAPEQARGAVEQVDARTDVFTLGGILCQILTGAPPYRGQTREEVFLRASRAWLDDAHRRLDICGGDGELVLLAHRCLAVDPASRPADAGAVAAAASDYLAAVEQRARELAIEAAQAHARATQEARARRATLLTSIVIVASLLAGAWALVWYERRENALRADAEQRAHAGLARLIDLRDRAQSSTQDKVRLWGEATVVAREAEQLAGAPHVSDELRQRLRVVRAEVERDAQVELRDASARALIDELRPHRGEDRSPAEIDADHRALFALFGVDPDTDDSARVVAALTGSRLHHELATALHHWVHLLRARRGQEPQTWQRLLALADGIDPRPWNVALRRHCSLRELPAMRALAADPEVADVAGNSLGMLAECVAAAGDKETAVRTYRLAHWLQPHDYSIAHDLGVLLMGLPEPPRAEITRVFTAAAAVRPDNAHALVDLASAFLEEGQTAPARVLAKRAIATDPEYQRAWLSLAGISSISGDLEGAVAAAREGVRLRVSPRSLLLLAHALAKAGDAKGALAASEQAVQLAPRSPATHAAVSSMQVALGYLDAAITTQRQVLTFAESDAETWYQLGVALERAGIANEAEAAYRRTIELQPDYAEAHCNLGNMLACRGAFDAALACVRRGAELGARQLRWPHPTAEWIARIERQKASVARLDEVAAGAPLPDNRDEAIELASVALARGDALLAFTWFDTIYRRERGTIGREYIDVVRAAVGLIAGDAPVGAAASPQKRIEASRAALSLMRSVLRGLQEQDEEKARAVVELRHNLSQWLLMPDLEPLRQLKPSGVLPADEVAAWGELWAEVRQVFDELQGR